MAGSSLPSFDFQAGADQLHADAAALIQQAAVQLGLLPDPAHGAGAAGGRAAAATPAGAALDDALLRSEVCCPITHEIMEEPVIAADGTTYEKHAIESESRCTSCCLCGAVCRSMPACCGCPARC